MTRLQKLQNKVQNCLVVNNPCLGSVITCSCHSLNLQVTKTCKCAGDRAVPRLWNNLPFHVCNASSADSIKSLLKSRLFDCTSVAQPTLSVRRGKVKETSRFLSFFPNFSSFFPIFPEFFPIFLTFPNFWQFFHCQGWHSAPPCHPSGYATVVLIVRLVCLFISLLTVPCINWQSCFTNGCFIIYYQNQQSVGVHVYSCRYHEAKRL